SDTAMELLGEISSESPSLHDFFSEGLKAAGFDVYRKVCSLHCNTRHSEVKGILVHNQLAIASFDGRLAVLKRKSVLQIGSPHESYLAIF
ncbi:hypothetical protein E2562_031680, partial [Oryza meyeriana var. granulata]